MAPELATRRRVIALDQRGHGASVRTPGYSFEAMRDDLLEFVDQLGLGTFLLMGHSMGGSVAASVRQPLRRLTERVRGA
jgi:pimeloyl-ACP methyl ester carboxylesterase